MFTRDLRKEAQKYSEKLKKIKVLAFDVDGVLTEGLISYEGQEMQWNRQFNVQDGYMLHALKQLGYCVGVITGGCSDGVMRRFGKNGLDLDFFYYGNVDKRENYKKLLEQGHKDEEILFVGDEFIDLPILKRVGFSATTPEASIEIQESVDYITERLGGRGAAREVMDMFRYANNLTPILEDF